MPNKNRDTFAAPGLLAAPPAAKSKQSPNIGFERVEVTAMRKKWQLIDDCLAGSDQIKAAGDRYLPRPNAADQSEANKARFDNYVLRAVFYNVGHVTVEGMVGQVFSRDPIMKLPDDLKSLVDDIDGTGVSLDQQSRRGLIQNIARGGFGLLVDYPVTATPLSLAQRREGYIRPTITQYDRLAIINWRFKKVGAKQIFSLIVIHESASGTDDGFEVTTVEQWRVLKLDEAGEYTVTTYTRAEADEGYVATSSVVKPKGPDGLPMRYIPFYFCGSLNNSPSPDIPIIYNLCTLNIAHYRNSADYEDSCYIAGQPTPVFAGLTEQWVNRVFKNKTIQMGARAAIPLPQGATAQILQASPNSMPKEAMDQKEKQMAAMGAKLIEPGSGTNTLGQAQLDESTESSMLAVAAKNVSLAYTMALIEAAKQQGLDTEEMFYSLNTDFPASRLTPNERTQVILEWQAGAITQSEMRACLRKAGVATLDEDEYKTELLKNPPPVTKEATNNQDKGGADNDKKKNKDTNNNGGNQAKT